MRLDPPQQRRILAALRSLERDPLPPGKRVRKLQTSHGNLYRLRVGNFRIIYELSPEYVDILGIVSRDELERFIKGL